MGTTKATLRDGVTQVTLIDRDEIVKYLAAQVAQGRGNETTSIRESGSCVGRQVLAAVNADFLAAGGDIRMGVHTAEFTVPATDDQGIYHRRSTEIRLPDEGVGFLINGLMGRFYDDPTYNAVLAATYDILKDAPALSSDDSDDSGDSGDSDDSEMPAPPAPVVPNSAQVGALSNALLAHWHQGGSPTFADAVDYTLKHVSSEPSAAAVALLMEAWTAHWSTGGSPTYAEVLAYLGDRGALAPGWLSHVS